MSSDEEKIKVVRNATDLQRLKLEKLMKNPEKPAFIPERSKDKKFPNAPEFVRNVMGSSAGAGSGEFHVYRHIRRREYARQEYLNQLSEKDRLDLEYKEKLEDNRRRTEQRAAKKRAKRQRAKQRGQAKRRKGDQAPAAKQDTSSSESEEDSDVEGRDAEQSCDQEPESKKDKDMPITQEVNKISESSAIVNENNERDATNITADEAVTETKGDREVSSVEQNKIESITSDTTIAREERTLPEGDVVPRSPDKPQKKSLKELLKTTASKLNLELNIDR